MIVIPGHVPDGHAERLRLGGIQIEVAAGRRLRLAHRIAHEITPHEDERRGK
jgi:hypothetical protein